MAEAQIIYLSEHRSTTMPSSTAEPTVISNATESAAGGDRQTSFEDLYGTQADNSRSLLRARAILQQSADRLAAALNALSQDDELGADLAATEALAIWPELFLLRDISEGFGQIVLAIHYSFRNKLGALLSAAELLALQTSIEFLRDNPFLSFEVALDVVEALEAAGFQVDPPTASSLSEIFAEA